MNTDNPDVYRMAIPSANNKTFFKEGTSDPNPDAYHGIYVTRTGVQKIGDSHGAVPDIVDGNIVNHGGEQGDRPLSAYDVAQRSWEMQRMNQ